MKLYITYLLTILLGAISGILGGALGLGITIVALPGFIFLKILPNLRTSIGTTLFTSLASWPAAYEYYKYGNVNFTIGILYFIIYSLFSYLGSYINKSLTEQFINYSLSVVHILIGLYFFYLA